MIGRPYLPNMSERLYCRDAFTEHGDFSINQAGATNPDIAGVDAIGRLSLTPPPTWMRAQAIIWGRRKTSATERALKDSSTGFLIRAEEKQGTPYAFISGQVMTERERRGVEKITQDCVGKRYRSR